MKLFICHASEDKEQVARPLAELLKNLGIDIWYDEYSLELGDSLRQCIEKGLVDCDYGVVILSPTFFRKEWSTRELDSLTAREVAEKRKIIIPIWHEINESYLVKKSPNLADKIAISTEKGIENVAIKIAKAVGYHGTHRNRGLDAIPREEIEKGYDVAEIMYMNSLAMLDYISEYQELPSERRVEYIRKTADVYCGMKNDFIEINQAAAILDEIAKIEKDKSMLVELREYRRRVHEEGLRLVAEMEQDNPSY